MSLQVWLPLNGSLENLGLDPIQPSKINGTTNLTLVGGKVTNNNYKWTTDGQGISLNGFMNTFKNYTSYTLCSWVYFSGPASNHSSVICSSGDWNQSANQLVFGLYSYDGGYKHILVPNRAGWSEGVSVSNKLIPNTWYHIAASFNGVNTLVYLNGEYIGQYPGGGITPTSNSTDLHIGRATYYVGFTIKGQINDFRIYDNALSPKEIREIANGLMIHYPMRDMYIESSIVNLTGEPVVTGNYSASWDSSLHPGAQQVSGWSAGYNSGVSSPSIGHHAYWKTLDGIPTIIMTNKYSQYFNTARWLGVSSTSKDTTTKAIMEAGVYTISFDAKTDTPGTKITGGLHSRLTSATKDAFNDGQFSFFPTTEWKRYSITITPNANIDSTKGSRVYLYGYTGAEGIVYIKNPQLVAGETTMYIGNQVTGGGPCIDSSGYYNNANITAGKITYSNDSPRGYGSFKFNGASYLKTENILIPQQHTFSFWINRRSAGHLLDWRAPGSEVGIQPVYFNDSGQIQYYSSAKADAAINYFDDSVAANEWHHVALTCDGTSVKYYLDGKYKQTKQTSIAADWNHPLSIGARVTNANIINANMADLRIYSTALSADEILKLYNVPIWIDENQALGAIGFVEENIDNNKFEKTGTIETREIDTIIEIDATNDLYTHENTKIKIYDNHILAKHIIEI